MPLFPEFDDGAHKYEYIKFCKFEARPEDMLDIEPLNTLQDFETFAIILIMSFILSLQNALDHCATKVGRE